MPRFAHAQVLASLRGKRKAAKAGLLDAAPNESDVGKCDMCCVMLWAGVGRNIYSCSVHLQASHYFVSWHVQ